VSVVVIVILSVRELMSSTMLSKRQKKRVKSSLPVEVVVGVGDTAERPGRTCRHRLGLPVLRLHAGPLATALETALLG
jgi:hypothetical protein